MRFSTTRSLCVYPYLQRRGFECHVRFSSQPDPQERLGGDADAARGHHQLAFLIAVFGGPFAKVNLPPARLLSRSQAVLPGLGFGGQHIAWVNRQMVFIMLLGVQAAGRFGFALERLTAPYRNRTIVSPAAPGGGK